LWLNELFAAMISEQSFSILPTYNWYYNNQVNSKWSYNFHEIEKKCKILGGKQNFITSEDLTNPNNVISSTCFPTLQEQDCMWVTLKGYTATDIFSSTNE